MDFRTEKRGKVRKVFRRSIGLDRLVTESNGMKHIQQCGVSINISESGLALISDFALKKGEVMKVLVPVSTGGPPLPVLAEVMWTYSSDDYSRTGLRFLG